MENQILSDKRAILISVKTQREKDTDILSSIEELKELSGLCGIESVDYMIQRMEKNADILSIVYDSGEGIIEEYTEEGIYIKGYIRTEKYYYIEEFQIS